MVCISPDFQNVHEWYAPNFRFAARSSWELVQLQAQEILARHPLQSKSTEQHDGWAHTFCFSLNWNIEVVIYPTQRSLETDWFWRIKTIFINVITVLQPRFFPWASYQIRIIMGCTCVWNTGNIFPATHFKGNHLSAIPACITARVSRTCRDACWDR